MGQPLQIRPYEPADEERVWEIHVAALSAVDAFADPEVEGAPPTDPGVHERGSRRLARDGVYLVGEVDGAIVATGALDPDGEATAEVTRMRVHPDHWRQGHGQAILDALESAALKRGYEELYLETLARQTAARALYEANGYEAVDRHVVDEFDVRRYEKSL